ncbi:MAG: Ig-like domain-containing protein [Coriobacteriia bacterium]|nr:Ig-like domain-containing protein [Coriobacteriia bacterium]
MRTFAKKLTASVAGFLLAAALIPAAALPVITAPDIAAAATPPTLALSRVNTGKVTIKKGTSYKIGAKVTSGSTLTYSSSKKSVATVSSKGTVTAKRYGKATITVKAKKNGATSTKKVYVTVTSAGKYKAVKKVYGHLAATSLTVGESTKASATFSPTSPSNRNTTFKSSNTDVATVTSYGTVKAKKAGTAYITLTSCYSSAKYAKVKLTVKAKPAPLPRPNARWDVEDYSWAELEQISALISATDSQEEAREVAQFYNLMTATGRLYGQQTKTFEMLCDAGGDPYVATVTAVIIGFRHDPIANGNGKLAGITFGIKEIVSLQPFNATSSNKGGYSSSSLRKWLDSSEGLYGRMPLDIQSKVYRVNKPTNNHGFVDLEFAPESYISNTSCYFFLPSHAEVFGSCTTHGGSKILGCEGTQYQMYEDLGVTDTWERTDLVKPLAGTTTPYAYWLRGPESNKSDSFGLVDSTYGKYMVGNADYKFGVSPCFCI